MSNSKKKVISKKDSISKAERLIYCGPNIPNGALQRYMVFRDGIPSHLNDLFAKIPVIKKLFVPVENLAKTKQAIRIKGTSQNVFYQQVLQFIKKGGV